QSVLKPSATGRQRAQLRDEIAVVGTVILVASDLGQEVKRLCFLVNASGATLGDAIKKTLRIVALARMIKSRRKIDLKIGKVFRRRLLYQRAELADGILITLAPQQRFGACPALLETTYGRRLTHRLEFLSGSVGFCRKRRFEVEATKDF